MNNPATFYDPTGQIVGTTFLQRNTLITAEAAALLGKIETALYLVILAGLLLHLADLVNEYLDKHNPPIITFPPTLNFSPPRLSPPSLPPLIPPIIPPIIPPVHTPPFEWPDLDDWLPNPPFPFPDEGNFEFPPFEIPELDDLLDLPPFEWNQFEVPPFFPFVDDDPDEDWYNVNGYDIVKEVSESTPETGGEYTALARYMHGRLRQIGLYDEHGLIWFHIDPPDGHSPFWHYHRFPIHGDPSSGHGEGKNHIEIGRGALEDVVQYLQDRGLDVTVEDLGNLD